MAGMFYSLQEAAEKLSKTEEEIKQLSRAGRLREFRDGPNLLFRVDEVEALLSDTSITTAGEVSAVPQGQTDEGEISLPPDSAEPGAEAGELTGADTVSADDEIGVLGETDSSHPPTDDTLAETKAASGEPSLEEIEEDVNLDTFGSGSGLLDLSLQADDTSLGGILDEIYTPEGEEEAGSAKEVAAEAEEMLPEERLVGVQPSIETAALARAYIEPQPDTVSNAFGIMLFLPLLVIVYTAIVVVAGFNDVMPAVMEKTQGIIWYILAGIAVAAVSIVGIAFIVSGGAGRKKKSS